MIANHEQQQIRQDEHRHEGERGQDIGGFDVPARFLELIIDVLIEIDVLLGRLGFNRAGHLGRTPLVEPTDMWGGFEPKDPTLAL
jgi:hypothetical protein